MNDLPTDTKQPQVANMPPNPVTASPSGAREIEPGGPAPQEGLKDATGNETQIPKEVAAAGVRVRPTTVTIPPPVAQMGVKPMGNNIPVQTTTSVVLPLSDDQIAAGLHLSMTNSVRWLAEWCVRRLKQLHVAVTSTHGNLMRVKE